MTTEINISAYAHVKDLTKIYGAIAGNELPHDFKGHCVVYFLGDAKELVFNTWLNDKGERVWFAEGNNPPLVKNFV